MVYRRVGILAKRLEDLEGKHSETICLELTVSKKKWCITFAYRPPSNDNKAIFFNELTTSLSQITNLYDYFVVMGDLNIDTSDKTKDASCYLSDLCDTFSLKNIVTEKTCFKKTTGTSIDILLTNRPRSFLKTGIYETDLINHHKLILSFFLIIFFKDSTENSEIYNFAEGNTISSISKEKQLLTTLEKDPEKAIDWFWQNNMIVNPKSSIQ